MNFLIKKAQKKNAKSFVKLMEMNKQDMYKVAKAYLKSNEDIADAISETILVCYEKIETLKEAKYFKTWLIKILINKCNDILRQNKRTCYIEEFQEAGSDMENESNIEFNELINFLDEKYRVIIILYYVEGFNIREIGEILELSENTVKTRLSRGRDNYAKMYFSSLEVGRR